MDIHSVNQLVDFSFAKRHSLLVEHFDESKALVLHTNRTPLEAFLELQRVLKVPLAFKLCTPEAFLEALNNRYESMQQGEIASDLENTDIQDVLVDIPENEDLLETQESAPIIKLLNTLLSQAIKMNASDIHFEVFKEGFIVRYRIDGILHEIHKLPKNVSLLLISRIKVMAKLDIAEKKVPQDGRINLKIAGRDIDVRVSTLPSNHGERAVLRILDKKQAKLDLKHLGARPEIIEQIHEMIHQPHGIILVTGPTGSGKTTTLYAAINNLNNQERNILTVEDPIEYDLTGVGQTQVNPKVGMTFAQGLRAILRQDPDVIMVGEIRDKETANIAIEASLTGHLVLSTLHTNNAIGAVIRLKDMGIQPYLIASSLLGVVAQRLVRRLCEACRKPYHPDESERAMLGDIPSPSTIYKPGGCSLCNGFGYKGRLGIYEIIILDETLKKMIHDQASETKIKAYANQQFDDLRQDGIKRVLSGETSLEEMLRVTQTQYGGEEV